MKICKKCDICYIDKDKRSDSCPLCYEKAKNLRICCEISKLSDMINSAHKITSYLI